MNDESICEEERAFLKIMNAMWNDEGGILETDYFLDLFGYKNAAEDASALYTDITEIFVGSKKSVGLNAYAKPHDKDIVITNSIKQVFQKLRFKRKQAESIEPADHSHFVISERMYPTDTPIIFQL